MKKRMAFNYVVITVLVIGGIIISLLGRTIAGFLITIIGLVCFGLMVDVIESSSDDSDDKN
jgi:hypothetical protein